MSENPHVRTINLFNPAVDLAVDETNVRLPKKRPPVNPMEGLLDDDQDTAAPVAPETGAGAAAAGRSGGPAPAGRQPTGRQPAGQQPASRQPAGQPAASSPPAQEPAAETRPLQGDVPDIIDGDFPEPIDL